MPSTYLAIDLGAESGRVIAGTLAGGQLHLEELHRFPNQPVRLPTGLYWDTLRLWHEILTGLTIAGRDRSLKPAGIGIDTWGVDFALLGPDGALADNPRHYRDSRNNGMVETTCAAAGGRERVFNLTGIQFLQINSLYQLHAMKLADSPALRSAETLLFMPDLFHYFLCGQKRAELTIASTSQFYDPVRGIWARELLDALGISTRLLPRIVSPGTRLGAILPHVAEQTGLPADTPVFATATHDTAAAVAAVPAAPGTRDWCYISSGTWSLMGVELPRPIVNPRALEFNLTNEIGAAGRVRLLKNIAGLWLLQEARRDWALRGHELSYEELASLAAAAPPFAAVIDPDAFLEPDRMPERIAAYCTKAGQAAPSEPGHVARVILESLALRYRQVLEHLIALTGQEIGTVHIVGGGSRNAFLNQLVADATGRIVAAGPAEATAAGNVLVQAIGAGEVANLDAAREVSRNSADKVEYRPRADARWDRAYREFVRLRGIA